MYCNVRACIFTERGGEVALSSFLVSGFGNIHITDIVLFYLTLRRRKTFSLSCRFLSLTF